MVQTQDILVDDLILGVDQGSSSTKVVLIDGLGETRFECSEAIKIDKPSAVESEQNLQEILTSVKNCIANGIGFAAKSGLTIKAIGLACQRSGVCAWRESDRIPLHNLIPWSDQRTKSRLDRIIPLHSAIEKKSKIPVTPHYAGGKISLLQEQFFQRPDYDRYQASITSLHLFQS